MKHYSDIIISKECRSHPKILVKNPCVKLLVKKCFCATDRLQLDRHVQADCFVFNILVVHALDNLLLHSTIFLFEKKSQFLNF